MGYHAAVGGDAVEVAVRPERQSSVRLRAVRPRKGKKLVEPARGRQAEYGAVAAAQHIHRCAIEVPVRSLHETGAWARAICSAERVQCLKILSNDGLLRAPQ